MNKIAERLNAEASKDPGVGMILLVFDDIERVRRNTNIAVVQRGIKTEDAVAMLRKMADQIERAGRDESRIILPDGPLILKSSKH